MERFRDAERTARESKKGLWADAKVEKPAARTTSSSFACSKKKCTEISTCDEAMFLLKECGLSRLDSDHDGIPCEALCGH
jgi:hypothetical protein